MICNGFKSLTSYMLSDLNGSTILTTNIDNLIPNT